MTSVTLPTQVIALCFVELNDQLDCNEGNEDSESFVFATISLNYSTFLQITLRHTCQFGRAMGRTFLKANSRALKTKEWVLQDY